MIFATFMLALTMQTADLSGPMPEPQTKVFSRGAALYTQRCASCHGANFAGGTQGPSLRGVGAADLDFMVGTGRMPAAVPWVEPSHRHPLLSSSEIHAIVVYVTTQVPGGEPIPTIAKNGNAAHGEILFTQNCEHCHGATLVGAAIGAAEWAPNLGQATPLQIGEAVRVGPGEMPRFLAAQLSDADIADLVSYIGRERTAQAQTRLPLDSGGVVAEGLIAWLAIGIVVVGAYALART